MLRLVAEGAQVDVSLDHSGCYVAWTIVQRSAIESHRSAGAVLNRRCCVSLRHFSRGATRGGLCATRLAGSDCWLRWRWHSHQAICASEIGGAQQWSRSGAFSTDCEIILAMPPEGCMRASVEDHRSISLSSVRPRLPLRPWFVSRRQDNWRLLEGGSRFAV